MTSSSLPFLRRLLLASAFLPSALSHGVLDITNNFLTPFTLHPTDLDITCPLPLEDSDRPTVSITSSPWTHPPTCEYTVDKKTKYCVYTNSRHGSRGWSIIATPETAADSAWMLNHAVNNSATPVSFPGIPGGQQRCGTAAGEKYTMVDIPGKGKGLVATRKIARYEEILVDYATIMVDVMFTSEVPAFKGYKLLHKSVAQLQDPGSVLGLGKSNPLARDDVENILRTNAFSTELGGRKHIALFPIVSRINHACKPNAYIRFIPSTLQATIHAARDIPVGEEITISYIPVDAPTSERAEKLSSRWHFTCHCSLCQAPASEREISDSRRSEIQKLRSYQLLAYQAGRAYQALRFTRQIVELLAPEELWDMFAEQYENMARIFWMLKDRKNAEKYARMSLEKLEERGEIGRGEAGKEGIERMFARFDEEEGPRE